MRLLARRYAWASPEAVLDMTPHQASIYAADLGGGFDPSMALMAGMLGAGSGIGAGDNSGGGGWRHDARFPGKKMRTCRSMSEAQRYLRR